MSPFVREPEEVKAKKASTVAARLSVVEDRLRQIELSATEPGASASYTDLQELRAAVIAALHGLRSQGAYNLARVLEEKYFEGKDVRGFERTVTSDTLVSGGG